MRATAAKSKIIGATKTLLKSNPNITVKEIAEASYVNVAAINYYFGSKNHLINIISTEFVNELKEGIIRIIIQHTGDSDLKSLFDETFKFVKDMINDNFGILYHLLNNVGNDQGDVLLESFFSNSPFIDQLLNMISIKTGIEDKDRVSVIYIMIFASIIFPMRFKTKSMKYPEFAEFIKSDRFDELLLEEMDRLIKRRT